MQIKVRSHARDLRWMEDQLRSVRVEWLTGWIVTPPLAPAVRAQAT